jgi:uncharacterized protein (TIGR01777 family)
MRVAITGATGLIGSRLVSALGERGDSALVLSRDPDRARERLGGVDAVAWDPLAGPAPADALSGADGVVNLAGEPIAQRWGAGVKERIRESRIVGTENLVAGLEAASPRPAVLVSASGTDVYGDRGDTPLEESAPPGPPEDFLATVCVDWERAAAAASELGIRVVCLRTGVVLDRSGGALAKMLPPFRTGIGGPIAGGRQYVPWIHLDDVVAMYVAALDGGGRSAWSGPVNACAPEPVTNAAFSRALGRALHRPAVMPVPGLALKILYGEMATVVTSSHRMIPARALELGFEYRYGELDTALAAALG